jgi:hypothetical protein
MAEIGEVTVEEGDLLRRMSDDREGRVVSTTAQNVIVQFPPSLFDSEPKPETAPASQWYYNPWDPKYEKSGREVPVRQPTDMSKASE